MDPSITTETVPAPEATGAGGHLPFALVLGGGGARGLAHIGVLLVLEREGLKPTAIAGTSMGAIVGALYAAGHAPSELSALVDSFDFKAVAAVTVPTFRPGSLLSADRFERRMRDMLPATFAELGLPFAAVAADIVTGDPVEFTEGELVKAIRAGMSLPMVFEPVRWGEMLLLDGGLVEPLPVAAVRRLSDAPVVAVDVGPLAPVPTGDAPPRKPAIEASKAPNIVEVGIRSFDLMQNGLAREARTAAAVVITPDVGGYLMADFLEGPTIVAAGVTAAEAALPALRAMLVPPPPEPEVREGLLRRLGKALGLRR